MHFIYIPISVNHRRLTLKIYLLIIIVQGITIHVLLIEIFVMSGPSMCLFDMNKITVKILFGYAEMVDVKSLVLIRFCSFSLEKPKTTPSWTWMHWFMFLFCEYEIILEQYSVKPFSFLFINNEIYYFHKVCNKGNNVR